MKWRPTPPYVSCIGKGWISPTLTPQENLQLHDHGLLHLGIMPGQWLTMGERLACIKCVHNSHCHRCYGDRCRGLIRFACYHEGTHITGSKNRWKSFFVPARFSFIINYLCVSVGGARDAAIGLFGIFPGGGKESCVSLFPSSFPEGPLSSRRPRSVHSWIHACLRMLTGSKKILIGG